MKKEFDNLSKMVSQVLRHSPELYGLTLDQQGWASINDLIISLGKRGVIIDEQMLDMMIEKSTKKRHQILDGKIRAYYGHSIQEKIIKEPSIPPSILFHGTSKSNLQNILKEGLTPMKRNYVHLSEEEKMAWEVANRRGGDKIVLKIHSIEAFKSGVIFYKEENGVWLSETIRPIFIFTKDEA